ncbi:hypothetical protein NIIDNTM18_42480 [Mycolicibacterium litorale]|uniref:Uncharacterized protein n=1 Tax=Mycolicibacterium litorale TaxID=758802 RepID=A0A6S6PE93_9MYCO|nr:hypothetical protein [Mycolicibacterium litorale]BCI54970.1 hypothetical protein NIIDNTM18_42480 [Mycolicibacterium litorale]
MNYVIAIPAGISFGLWLLWYTPLGARWAQLMGVDGSSPLWLRRLYFGPEAVPGTSDSTEGHLIAPRPAQAANRGIGDESKEQR